jgi:hypothetical protein
MTEDFRLNLMDMMTGVAPYVVEMKMVLVKRGIGRRAGGGYFGAEKWHREDRRHVDFSGPAEADRAIFSLREIASGRLVLGGSTIWEVRYLGERTVRFDGHPSGFMISYQQVLKNLNLRPEVVGKDHIIVHSGDPETYYDCQQAVSDRENEAARKANEGKVHRGTYPLSHFGAPR